MHDLRWLKSYETVLLDTPDGDLERGQFFRYEGCCFTRLHPKNNQHWVPVEEDDVKGMEEVFIREHKGAYYDEFALPDGRRYRVRSDRRGYQRLAIDNLKAARTVSDEDISDIKKDDDKWQ